MMSGQDNFSFPQGRNWCLRHCGRTLWQDIVARCNGQSNANGPLSSSLPENICWQTNVEVSGVATWGKTFFKHVAYMSYDLSVDASFFTSVFSATTACRPFSLTITSVRHLTALPVVRRRFSICEVEKISHETHIISLFSSKHPYLEHPNSGPLIGYTTHSKCSLRHHRPSQFFLGQSKSLYRSLPYTGCPYPNVPSP